MKPTCQHPDGCNDLALSRLLCSMHYQRAKAAGILDEIAPNPSGDCLQCGKHIEGRRWGAVYCSTDCKQVYVDAHRVRTQTQKLAREDRLCAWCRELIDGEKRYGTRFCSSPCNDNWHNNQRRLALLRAKKARQRMCEACGEPIPPERVSTAIYCSRKCKRRGTMSHHPRVRNGQQEYNRQYLYGISTEEFDARLAAQGGVCAACGTAEWGGKTKSAHIDHDHRCDHARKGALCCPDCIRGLLCSACNRGIGVFGDDPARLRAAADYLERAAAAARMTLF